MRLIVVKEASDLQTLGSKLLSDSSKASGKSAARNAVLERVKSLNPHVDFKHMDAGTVLLLPDSPELKESESRSFAGDAFADFFTQATEGLNSIAQGIRAGAEASTAGRAAVNAATKTVSVKRQLERDPMLKKQLDDASAAFDAEQKRAQSAAMQVEAMQKTLAKELKSLGGLLK